MVDAPFLAALALTLLVARICFIGDGRGIIPLDAAAVRSDFRRLGPDVGGIDPIVKFAYLMGD